MFYLIDRTKCCGVLQAASWRQFKTLAMPNLHEQRQSPALCLFKNSFVYASGGKGRNCAERFDIETRSWEKVAKMNVVRYQHSSCALGDQIYIFCGMRDSSEAQDKDFYFPTIERLEVGKTRAFWEEVNLEDSPTVFLISPAVAPLNKNEILILGGRSPDNLDILSSDQGYCSDAVIYDKRDG